MTLVQRVKSKLVKLGPDGLLVKIALAAHGKMRGFTVTQKGSQFLISRGDQEMVLNKSQFVQIPIMEDCFELFFDTIKPVLSNGRRILDFSQPGVHEYLTSGKSFYFPSVPEDDVMDAYTREYSPKPGDVVWDVGAHAGASTYFLAEMVGPSGRVFAFEPDEKNYPFLLQNIDRHKLNNVIPVKKALSGATGFAKFSIHFAIESHRLEDGRHTHEVIAKAFDVCDYKMEAATHRGQFFAWATRKSELMMSRGAS